MKLCVALVTLLYVSQHALGVQVHVYEGAESVLLPCQVTVSVSQDNAGFWSLEHLFDQIVHLRVVTGDQLTDQNQKYRGRTSMRPDALTTGDLSLTLRNPTIRDSDTYTCIYNEEGEEKSRQEVHLEVTVHPWDIIRLVLAVLLPVLLAAAVVGFIWFMWQDGRTVKQVEVEEWAESVLLPFRRTDTWWVKMRMCRIRGDLSEDVRVEWRDRGDMKVHVYQNGSEEQDQVYRDRTEMKKDLKTGDFSLTLRRPTFIDTGDYTCRVYNKDGDLLRVRRVQLKVKVKQGEVVEGTESVQLPFKTTADLPEDIRVEWMDREDRKVHVYQNGSVEQDQVYRGRTEMKKDLKTGDFSLTLRHPTFRDRGEYTCRVFNKDRDLLREIRVELKVKVQQVEVVEGAKSVLLPVKTTADLLKDVRVEWMDPLYRKVHVYQNGSVEQDQVYRGRTEMKKDLMETGDFSLTLRHPTVRDIGDYTCRVYNKDGDLLRERRVKLWVKGKQQVEMEEGAESVQLPFKTTADLPGDIRVEWTDRDNRKVHVYQNGSVEQGQVYRGRTEMKKDLKTGDFSLILRHPTVRDRGEYTCRVYNKDGDLLRGTIVELKVPGQQVDSGKEFVELLSFNTTADLPEDIRVEWMDKDNRKVHVYQNGSVEQDQVYRGRTEMNEDLMKTGDFRLTLRHPTERDRGEYTCRVYNKDGDLLRGTRVYLKVKGQQVEVEGGAESVQLPFNTTADLPKDVTVEWTDHRYVKVHVYQNGSDQPAEQHQVYRGRTEMKKDLKTGDFSLILRHPTARDRGYYYCRVYNKDGDLLRGTRVDLKVKERPGKKKQSPTGTEAAQLMAEDLV